MTAALAARHAGATVCLIEREHRLGGDCTFYGCVPSKTLLAVAQIAHDARAAAGAGILDVAPSIAFSAVAAHRDATVAALAEDERDERFTFVKLVTARRRLLRRLGGDDSSVAGPES